MLKVNQLKNALCQIYDRRTLHVLYLQAEINERPGPVPLSFTLIKVFLSLTLCSKIAKLSHLGVYLWRNVTDRWEALRNTFKTLSVWVIWADSPNTMLASGMHLQHNLSNKCAAILLHFKCYTPVKSDLGLEPALPSFSLFHWPTLT